MSPTLTAVESTPVESDPVERYLGREPLTQSLAHAGILQARGLGCVFTGAAVLLLQHRDGALVARMQRPRQLDLALISSVAERVGAERVHIDPAGAGLLIDRDQSTLPWRYDPAAASEFVDAMKARGLALTRRTYCHTKTRIIDLRGGSDPVLAQMSGVARRNGRLAVRDGVTFEARPFGRLTSDEVEQLRRVHEDFMAQRPQLDKDDWGYRVEMMRQFGASGELVMAHEHGALVGAVYMPRHDGVAYYYAVVTSHRATSARVGTGLVIASIEAAIAAGCDLFDFFGVRDERYPDRYTGWDGFTAFKQRFGGHEVYMPPSLVLGR